MAAGCAVKNWREFSEPVLLLYVLMVSIVIVPKDKIYIDKVCKLSLNDFLSERNLTTDVCNIMSSNETFKEIEKETQRHVSKLQVYGGIINGVPMILFSIIAGNFADKVGRTVFMAIPFIGCFLSSIWLIITVYWWETFTPEYLLFLGIEGFFGGAMCFNMGLFSYIADTTKSEDRTSRMSLLTGLFDLGYLIGVQLGGRIHSYILVFSLSASFALLGFVYSTFILKESLNKANKSNEKIIAEINSKQEEIKHNEEKKSLFKILFDSVLTLTKKRPGNTRLLALLAFFEFQVFIICMTTQDYDYLMTRIKFSWEREDFSNYLTVQRISRLVRLLILLPLMSKRFKISDDVIVMIGCVLTLTSYTMLTVGAPSWGGDWPLYLSVTLQLNSVTTSSIISILSKLFDVSEIAKVYAVIGIVQSIVAMSTHSLLGLVYHGTLSTYPSMYLVPVDILLLITCVTSALAIYKR